MKKHSPIREKVLAMARKKFLHFGFYNMSMDSLVKELHTSKSSLYNHFESKDVLVKEVLLLLNKEINEKLEQILRDEALSFKEKLVSIFDFTRQTLVEVSDAFLSDLEIHTPKLWAQYEKMRSERINRYYKSLFEIGIKEGLIRSDINLDLVLTVYLSLTEIPLRQQHTNKLTIPHENIYEQVTDIFLNGIRTEISFTKRRG